MLSLPTCVLSRPSTLARSLGRLRHVVLAITLQQRVKRLGMKDYQADAESLFSCWRDMA
jgi:hypothetical protein